MSDSKWSLSRAESHMIIRVINSIRFSLFQMMPKRLTELFTWLLLAGLLCCLSCQSVSSENKTGRFRAFILPSCSKHDVTIACGIFSVERMWARENSESARVYYCRISLVVLSLFLYIRSREKFIRANSTLDKRFTFDQMLMQEKNISHYTLNTMIMANDFIIKREMHNYQKDGIYYFVIIVMVVIDMII